MTERSKLEEQFITAATGIVFLFILIALGAIIITFARFLWGLV